LVSGLIGFVAHVGFLSVPTTSELAWTHSPTFIAVTALAAAAYPIAGAILLLKASALATRWTSKPDEPAPAIIGLRAGTILLGVYFLVQGLHEAVTPAQRWIATRQFDSFAMSASIESIIFLVAGALLLIQPQWLTGHWVVSADDREPRPLP
jgi:hypothetical protein